MEGNENSTPVHFFSSEMLDKKYKWYHEYIKKERLISMIGQNNKKSYHINLQT